MRSGFLYVLSNPSFSPGVLKIGLTRGSAAKRASDLSRSSAIPTNFTVEFKIPVENVVEAERRVHLLLDPQRINPSKEFFLLELPAAIETCQAIAAYEAEDDTVSSEIGLNPRLLGARYHPSTALRTKQLIYLLIAATTNNTHFDRIFKQRRGRVDGFLTVAQASTHFRIGARAASRSMRKLAAQGDATSCHPFGEQAIGAIFDFIRYHKGHLAWRFADEFRANFTNPKI